MAENVYENQTFTAETFQAGAVFVNCIFYPSCQFGEGSVFQNCVFILDYYEPFHFVGPNSVFDGCVILWTVVSPNSTIANSVVAASIVLPPSFQAGIRYQHGRAVDFDMTDREGGVIVHANGRWSFVNKCDWDERMCSEGAIHIPDGRCTSVNLDLIKGSGHPIGDSSMP